MLVNNNLTFIGTGLQSSDAYSEYERKCWATITKQIIRCFPDQQNLLISLTWFGPQFDNQGWQDLLELESTGQAFDNLFLLATVDPPYLSVTEQQEVKNKVKALRVFNLGNFDSAHQFNFFAPILAQNFKPYTDAEITLDHVKHTFINYNRKPKPHRVAFVKQLMQHQLLSSGIVTLGRSKDNDLYLTLGEKQEDYVGSTYTNSFGLPMDYYSLHRMDIWKHTFLYINGATEFDPVNDLFCQQDTFKPMLGLRPFVINGVQRTYRWLRAHGFKTFNHYWPHIDIENGNVHQTLVDLIKHLNSLGPAALQDMYTHMLPLLHYNKQRFAEFAVEQKFKMENIFQ